MTTTTPSTTPSTSRRVLTESKKPFIPEPPRINPLLHLALWVVERRFGQRFVPIRLMAWSPRVAVSWWLGLDEKPVDALDKRILSIVAIAAASTARSPYCLAANLRYESGGLSDAELDALREGADASMISSFSARERLAVRYARLISSTPLEFPEDFIAELTAAFTPREIVMLASRAAVINHNSRLIEALGAPAPVFNGKARR